MAGTPAQVVLSPLSPTDAEALFAYRSLEAVRRYQTWEPVHPKDAIGFIAAQAGLAFDTPGTWFQLGIRMRDGKALVGDIGVHFLEDGEQVEIGITLAPAAQGCGIATEAVEMLLDHLFGALGKHRVIASVDPRNGPSVRLLERVGMRREAYFVQALLFKGEWADDVVYAVLASEWAARRSAG
jgi:RimJ/RimL family protein N-acetyltransferase